MYTEVSSPHRNGNFATLTTFGTTLQRKRIIYRISAVLNVETDSITD